MPFDRPVSIGEASSSHEYFNTFGDAARIQQHFDDTVQKFFQETHLPSGNCSKANKQQHYVLIFLSFSVDPTQWNESNVFTFSQWTSVEFQLPINLQLFQGINGLQLCSFTQQQFHGLAKESGHTLFTFLEKIKASATCKLTVTIDHKSLNHCISLPQ